MKYPHVAKAATRHLPACLLLVVISAGGLSGCALGSNPQDPWEPMNRTFYGFNQVLDTWIGRPVARGYNFIVPKFIRQGLHNGFANVAYFNVILNGFLQGKGEQALQDSARMAINSTIGILGFFDPATGMGFPSHEEDFGQTLAVWGYFQGPYLVLPLLGPTTTRDMYSIPVAVATNPLFYLNFGVATVVVGGFRAIDERADVEEKLQQVDAMSLDRYVFIREGFLARREFLARDANPTTKAMDQMYDDFTDEELADLEGPMPEGP